ncbi:hypothetical protein HMPREF1155_0371 [Slackia sp. CM382]|nr:hypothetical protein HMPREF1155_0371 [Slackia sp. CM382]
MKKDHEEPDRPASSSFRRMRGDLETDYPSEDAASTRMRARTRCR